MAKQRAGALPIARSTALFASKFASIAEAPASHARALRGRTGRGPTRTAYDTDAHLVTLIDRVVNRAGQVVRRELERRHARGRKSAEE